MEGSFSDVVTDPSGRVSDDSTACLGNPALQVLYIFQVVILELPVQNFFVRLVCLLEVLIYIGFCIVFYCILLAVETTTLNVNIYFSKENKFYKTV